MALARHLAVASSWYSRHAPQSRRPGMASATVLLAFVLIGLLDSLHYRALLPADARPDNGGFVFTLPQEGIEALLVKLIEAGHGISGLSIERPSLHDAFVQIVGRQALEAAR